MDSLQSRLKELECHFTWDLGSFKNELESLRRNLQNLVQQTCTWLVHYYNLLGYILQALGHNTEALADLQKAERLIQEQGTKKAGARLQVNKANLAWVYFLMGNVAESRKYLQEVEELQQKHPAPAGCALHPEVSGEKGWTLLKFNLFKKRQSIDFFRMALKAEPQSKEWNKGLALAMTKPFLNSDITPDEILEQLKTAIEKEPDSLLLQALYLLKLSEFKKINNERELQNLSEKTLDTGNLEGLGVILRCFQNISTDRAIQEGERVREKFPTSIKVLRHLEGCYKWKVYSIREDSEERQTWAERYIELSEKIREDPVCLSRMLILAMMYRCAHNIERADEIYKELLLQQDDLPPTKQQYLYYNYAYYLYERGQHNESISFHMKVAEIQDITDNRQKSIKILRKIVDKGRDRRCNEISNFLKKIKQ